MRTILTVLLLFFVSSLFAQYPVTTTENYLRYVDSAQHLYKAKDYKASAQLYEKAFRDVGLIGRNEDHYNAACSWAQAGDREKAITQLEMAVLQKWSGVTHMQKDNDLTSLHDHKSWANIIVQAQKNKEEKAARLDKALVAQLDTLFEEDQALRRQVVALMKEHGWESKEVQDLLPSMRAQDSVNLLKVKSILDTRGWLGPDIVGAKGSQTLFLVIQHADSATQEQYLPLLRQAVKEGKAQPSQLALLEDRTRISRGEKQLYGSQYKTDPVTGKDVFFPIEDEPNVNKRRATMGLIPLEVYAREMGIEYTLPKK